jgi:hypothetical protein
MRLDDKMRFGFILAFAILALQGCAHHQPVWAEGTLIRISGKASQGLAPEDAFRQLLAEAARVTVDHGHRYFVLVNAPSGSRLQPGASLDIRMLHDNKRSQGAFDAYRLLEAQKTG